MVEEDKTLSMHLKIALVFISASHILYTYTTSLVSSKQPISEPGPYVLLIDFVRTLSSAKVYLSALCISLIFMGFFNIFLTWLVIYTSNHCVILLW